MDAAPFTPDDLYCAYCHAPAAGQCASCGALCCADCVELVSVLVTPRAICRSCVRDGSSSAAGSTWARRLRWAAALAVLTALLAYYLHAGT